MERRTLLKRIGAASLVGLVGAEAAAASGDVHPNACPICPGDECPGVGACKHCVVVDC